MRTRSTIEALYARGLVTLEHNAKGAIVAAHERHLRKLDSVDRIQLAGNGHGSSSGHLAPTRYSFEDTSIEGRPWDLKRLNGKRSGLHYAPPEVQPIFLRVVLECLA